MIEVAVLILRVVVGLLFMGHGAGKLFGWFAGFGLDGTGEYFESLGYRRGRRLALLAGLTEVGAGAAFAAGLLTPVAAAGLVGLMISAAVAAHGEQGLWSENEGYEYPLVLIVVALAVTLAGPGAYSIDAALGLPLEGAGWTAFSAALGGIAALGSLAIRRPHGVPASSEVRHHS
jgi:putative oxidoreductase